MEKTPKKEEKRRFEEYASNATIHGVKQLIDAKRVRRYTWMLLLLGLFGCLVVSMAFRGLHYLKGPVTSRMRSVPVEKLETPAATFCNLNLIKESSVEGDEFLKQMLLHVDEYPNFDSTFNESEPATIAKANSYDWGEIYENGSLKAKEFLTHCVMGGEVHECEDFVSTTVTSLGYCYTFNSQELIKERGRVMTSKTGITQGLQVVVDLHQWDYFFQKSMSAGVRILLHDPYEWPDVENNGVTVSPGTETFLSYTVNKEKRMPPPYEGGECVDTSDPDFVNPLTLFEVYTQPSCVRECYIKYITQECHCLPPDVKMKGAFSSQSNAAANCMCRAPCETTTYFVTKSEGIYPSNKKAEILLKLFPYVEDIAYFRNNTARIVVYPTSMEYLLYEDTPAYTLGDFQSDLGGNLGLCLGASILSLVELLEFIVLLFMSIVHNSHKGKTETAA